MGDVLVEFVDFLFHALDVGGLHAQWRVLGVFLHRGGQIGATVEELVLDAAQDAGVLFVRLAEGQDLADHSVGFLAVCVRLEAGIVLGNAVEVGQACRAVVAGAGVNLCNVYSHNLNPTEKISPTT